MIFYGIYYPGEFLLCICLLTRFNIYSIVILIIVNECAGKL